MSHNVIIPAIIPQSREDVCVALERMHGIVFEFQIDVVDGMFAPEMLPNAVSYELDLMIAAPMRTLPLWLARRPKSVVLHIESFVNDTDITRAVEVVRTAGTKAILASLNDTPLERLLALVPQSDGVQCMGIAEIGVQGNPFDERVVARVRRIREAYPALSISVDGSMNANTIPLLKSAGANRFVVGSGVFSTDDPVRAHKELDALVRS